MHAIGYTLAVIVVLAIVYVIRKDSQPEEGTVLPKPLKKVLPVQAPAVVSAPRKVVSKKAKAVSKKKRA